MWWWNKNDTYTVIAPNGMEVKFDKESNLIVSDKINKKGRKKFSKAVLDAREILDGSPYKDYKPSFYDPNPNAYGQTEYMQFKKWLDITYSAPPKGGISSWSKKEKAYYESLKDKRDRYIYLVKRSNLKSTMIDIPEDAMVRADKKGRLTKPEYAHIYDKVSANVNTFKSRLFAGEWKISAGILGNRGAFANASSAGFKAREIQALFLSAQLGNLRAIDTMCDFYIYGSYFLGLNENLQRSMEFKQLFSHIPSVLTLAKDSVFRDDLTKKEKELIYASPPFDEYGMIPYLDEVVGVDWVMDFNQGGLVMNPSGSLHRYLYSLIRKGKILDPRDPKATEETREEFMALVKKEILEYAEMFHLGGFPEEFTEKDMSLYVDSTLLEAKIMSLTPPEGYPNAPYYYTPEELKRLYESGKLDKKLNPTIPAMYKENFPKDLKEKIEEYALKHNITD
ncbi:MAG: thioredoxin reductase [Campylobacter sp.]|nr:thioredoxin reductase [Campylobacter sp.]